MIKFLDLYKINNRFRDAFQESFSKSLDDAHFILGNNVTTFENEFANYCGTKFCIGTGNGLDALTLILKGYIELGKLKKGDKVIVPANTFIATILSVIHAELIPVLVEPNPNTYTISVDTDKAIFVDAKALIMVHLYGQLADVEGLQQIAKDFNLFLFEDAAQAHGAILNSKKDSSNSISNSSSISVRAGSLSDAAAFSFYPSKNLGALGDGGAITTNDSELVTVIKLLRNYGSEEKYTNKIIGFNSRLDDMQAAFLSIKLKTLDNDNDRRREIAKAYLNGIKNPKLKLPFYDGSKNHIFYAFVVEVDDRADFIEFLNANQIEWLIHYPIPPHQQEALRSFSHFNLPLTENIHKRIISLPMSPVMIDKDIQSVISALNTY
ncbi:Aminotransferase, DegT/DnrJ/EryC1/StrS family [Winogradskyella psychrotolerans RS-3]|uniref:Aminotransferase, DegT/DnrJ/EryC1/StrS family n=1 Tax=Winogradskyella psychrotolerans RS-3 TaxID=641526 RepID=S7VV03_9FLAO|nr:DegT/DnrJ/EryC1/StrS family aminotransferase [Winogradskyella psychrotolerans]EPR73896.1 Aminotransferase, DegT/DnrJ/EryC1/StrS family [Winogradskyella psychrotolerans RS-3]